MSGALAGLVILAIGDSHMVYMLSPLHDALEQEGAVVHSYGMCGALASDYTNRVTAACTGERHEKAAPVLKAKIGPSWLLSDLLQKHQPNLVVIELGDNMAGYGLKPVLPADLITDEVRDILRPVQAKHLPCVWIGPPYGNENTFYKKTTVRVTELSQLLSHAVAPCRYIDTTRFARPGEWPTADGEHLTQESYRKWSVDIAGAIARMESEPH